MIYTEPSVTDNYSAEPEELLFSDKSKKSSEAQKNEESIKAAS